ncbi:hypothetical protein LWE61_02285 [Sphingobium sufflavum]|uniref:hypothetical protein n=1 Tax=Sphingobium sufflavum TaxID=1129547 RepID=UPI001F429371|nr:hypothetical protein [Sphingobium sufflavum]MCE7795380.1 hypothetical protein [Sphingobium sufflavum]
MFIAWWTGKGYVTMVIVLLTMVVFGLILQAGAPFLQDRMWYWGISFIAAAAINWTVGTRWNKKRIERAKPKHLGQRLWYPAINRFMSMPMETFSLVIAFVGLALIASGLASSVTT